MKRICEWCKEKYLTPRQKKFCSYDCFYSYLDKKATKRCEECGKKFKFDYRHQARSGTFKGRGTRFCSKVCRAQTLNPRMYQLAKEIATKMAAGKKYKRTPPHAH